MRNIYDDINDFYEIDPEWETLISKSYVEGYIRTLAWSGKTDEELREVWDDLTVFFVYLANAENFLGDMNRENFIDCVAWITRNIAGRLADYDSVKSLLEHLEGFYQYLGKKKLVRNQQAVSEAKVRMLEGNKINYMDEEGNILPQFKKSNIYPTADLPKKIFMDLAEHMRIIHMRLNDFLMDEAYEDELLRSEWIFSGFMDPDEWDELLEKNREVYLARLDYYLYDYHMKADDRRPIDVFYEEAKKGKYGEFSKGTLELLDIMTETHPIIFTIEDCLDDGAYIIKDLFTKESFPLMLPIEGEHEVKEFRGVLFYGHIFYNNTMTTMVVQGLPMTKKEMDTLKNTFVKTKDWFTSQESNSGTMDEFFQRHAALIPHFFRLHSRINNATLKDLEWLKKYEFENHVKVNVIKEDAVTKYLDEHLPNEFLSARDLILAKRLWTSYREKANVRLTRPELWAGAVLWNLGGINALFKIDSHIIVSMLEEVQPEDARKITTYGNKIYNTLELTPFDARYLNEEGLIKKFLSQIFL